MNGMTSSCTSILKLEVLFILVIFTACIAEERALFMVMMEGKPVAFHGRSSHSHEDNRFDPKSEVSKAHAKRLVDSHDQLLMTTLERGSYSKLYSFKHVLNGFAVHTTPSQASKLKYAEGVKLVEKDRGARLMTTYTPEFLGLPQGVWTEEGGERNAGDGIVIGFVDTGIDPTHPSFAFDPLNPFTSNISSHFSGACESGPRFPATSCNDKLISARFFSAGAQAAATLNTSVDFLSPFDAVGHGSHVASTAGGNAGVPVVVNGFFYGLASGMAPRARISVYKAVYPTVATLTDVVSAIDQAILDGVDILTLSVGPDEPPEDTVTFLSIFDIAMLYARRAGVFVVQAAGNKGPGPSTVVSYSPWAVGVAAASTDRSYPGCLLLGNGQEIGGVGLSGPSFGDGFFLLRLVLAKDAVKANGSFPKTAAYIDECQYPEAFDPIVVKGSIVICTFSEGFFNGTSTVTAVTHTAKALGFSGFLLVANPTYGDFVAEPIPFDVSGILIPKVADVQVILHYYEERTNRDEKGCVRRFRAKASIREGRVASFNGQEPTVSRFSSRGPDIIDADRNPTDVLKPDILAPGHQVWAAWSPMSVLEPALEGFRFALLSGTSMATPHVAGIAALIKQLNPSWTPSMIASAIATTATKYDQNNGRIIMAEGYGISSLYPSTAFELGSGLVSPKRAIDPGLVFSSGYEDYIAFLCSLPGMDPATIKNVIGESCNYSLTHPDNLNLPSITISALTGSRSVRRTVKNVQRMPETYLCAVLPPNGTTVNVHPPWFTIASQGSQQLDVEFSVTKIMDDFSFGEIVLTGSLNHIIRIPLSVHPIKV
ncbi:subtilisin-like protease SBT2.4 [Humulus lupulus]|uniref:subtilisin-like protease SBT2.4 n=1 Tax=Humulus lupulus TaxID=3486 RepID=UPI002B401861|nr:subtilisin-like protease SBT2.4 [Humulus lupulus]